LLFNHKYAEIVKTWGIISHVGISKAFFILLFVYHSENFQKCSVRLRLLLFLAYLLRTRVCTDFRNVNNKYFIVITSVEQSLQPVDYAWWQKQHIFTEATHIVLALRLLGVNVGYFW